MYRVKQEFFDLHDGNRHYAAGDTYPRPGLDVSEERIKYLAGDGNRLGCPLIEVVRSEERPTRKRVKKDD